MFIKARFRVYITLLCHDWYGHVWAQTSISKSNDRNKQIKGTWTESYVIQWSGSSSLTTKTIDFHCHKTCTLSTLTIPHYVILERTAGKLCPWDIQMLFHYRSSPLEILECQLQMKQMVQSHAHGNHGQMHLEGDLQLKLLSDCVPWHLWTQINQAHQLEWWLCRHLLLAFNKKFFQITKCHADMPWISVTVAKLTYIPGRQVWN